MSSSQGSVLVLNCGSSSVKFALLDPATGDRSITGLGERIGTDDAILHVHRGDDTQTGSPGDGSHHDVIAHLLDSLDAGERASLTGVGHRVVHGGRRFSASVLIDHHVLAALRRLVDLAPLHVPPNIAGIEAARATLPAGPPPSTPCGWSPCTSATGAARPRCVMASASTRRWVSPRSRGS
jgi:acetate kinase